MSFEAIHYSLSPTLRLLLLAACWSGGLALQACAFDIIDQSGERTLIRTCLTHVDGQQSAAPALALLDRCCMSSKHSQKSCPGARVSAGAVSGGNSAATGFSPQYLSLLSTFVASSCALSFDFVGVASYL